MTAFGGIIVMWPQAQRAERESGYVAVMPAHGELVAAGR